MVLLVYDRHINRLSSKSLRRRKPPEPGTDDDNVGSFGSLGHRATFLEAGCMLFVRLSEGVTLCSIQFPTALAVARKVEAVMFRFLIHPHRDGVGDDKRDQPSDRRRP